MYYCKPYGHRPCSNLFVEDLSDFDYKDIKINADSRINARKSAI